MSTLEQEIERRIAREMAAWQKQVTSKGEPITIDECWLHTPEGLRMPFRVLKNAGIPHRKSTFFINGPRLGQPLRRSRRLQHVHDYKNN
jgi:hypothetical protein